MALWKKGKKVKDAQDAAQKVGSEEISETDVSFVTATEIPPTKEEPMQEEQISESSQAVQEDLSGGVIMYGEKVSGVFRKGFWGIFSIIILPPVLVFAFGILVIIGMLIFPLLAVVLVASVPVVFVTLSIMVIALPILFPLLIIFLLVTDKGKLLIGSEGKWFGLEMFGKSYSLK